MKIYKLLPIILFLIATSFAAAQQDSLLVKKTEDTLVEKKDYKPYDPLAPARAAFYSAVLPGLGQAYNGKYWKIPLVYAGMGIGIYFYKSNNDQYERYRTAYKRRLAGYTDDEFTTPEGVQQITNNGLIRAQKLFEKNKEISLLVTAAIYALNIIDANVDAHLQQFNVSGDLSFKPKVNFDEFSGKTGYGLSLNYNF